MNNEYLKVMQMTSNWQIEGEGIALSGTNFKIIQQTALVINK